MIFNDQHLLRIILLQKTLQKAGLKPWLLLKFLKLSSFESISNTFVLEEVLVIPNNKLSTKFT